MRSSLFGLKELFLGAMAVGLFSVQLSGQITSFPFTENFDSEANCGTSCGTVCSLSGNLTNATTDDQDWLVNSGGTTSGGTGPLGDNTTGSGNYVYTEGSSGCSNQESILLLPTFDFSALTNPVLEFFYHMHGTSMGTITVEASVNGGTTWTTLFTLTGQQQSLQADPYLQAQVSLCTYAGNSSVDLRIVGNTGTSFSTDMAIDDIEVSDFTGCLAPALNAPTAISDVDATLNWGDVCALSYDWEVVPAGNAQGVGVVDNGNTTSLSATATGLSGNTNYDIYVRANCSGATSSAYSGPFTFLTACSPLSPPQTEDFTGGVPPTVCWDEADGGNVTSGPTTTGTSSWISDGFANQGFTGAARLNIFSTGLNEWLLSPAYDLTAGGPYQIEFLFGIYDFGTNTPGNLDSDDSLAVLISTNAGVSWTPVLVIDDTYVTNSITGNKEIIDLTSYSGSTVQFAFYGTTGLTGGAEDVDVFLDDVKLVTIPSCQDPSGLFTANLASSSVDLNWTENGSATIWDIEYGPSGYTQGTGSLVSGVTSNPYNLTGLASGTSYDFYVRSDCGASGGTGQSNWIGPVSFRTLPSPAQGVNCLAGRNPAVIFSEEFDNNSAGWTGDINSGNDSWEIPDDAGSSGTGADNAYSGSNYMNFEASSTATTAQGSIVSPPIDLTTGADEAELSFWMHAYGADMGTLEVGVGTSATGPFTNEFTWTGQLQNSGSDPWVNVGVDLTSYLGQTIYIQLTQIDSVGGFTGDMSIDLFEVSTCQSCPAPNNLNVASLTSSTADLGWTEQGSATVWDIEYGLTGFTQGAGTTVSGVTTNPYNLTGLSAQTTYDFYVRADCGGSQSPWSGPFTFTTPCATVTTFPYTETFDALSPATNSPFVCITTDNLTGCWTNDPGNPNMWTARNSSTPSSSTGPSADTISGNGNYIYLETSGGCANTSDLYSPPLDFTSLTTPRVSFFYHMWGSNMGSMELAASTDGGATWSTPIWSQSGDQGDRWIQAIVDLSAYASSSAVIFRFRGITNSHPSDVALDAITFEETPPCPDPSSLTVGNITATSADLGWTEEGSATIWDIEYGPSGFSQGAGTTVTGITTNPYNLTGLTANTAYDFYVRADCAAGGGIGLSNWVGPFTFTTSCIPFTAPYTQNFDGTTEPVLDQCWNVINTQGGSAFIGTEGFRNNSAPNSLEINNAGFTSGDFIAVSPQFTDLDNTKQVRFQVYDETDGSDLLVGTMSDPADETTFTLFTTITAADMDNDLWEEFTVNFSSYAGSDQYIAFRHALGTTFAPIYIDDFFYEVAPACAPPSSLSVNNVSATAADLAWTENGTATVWDIEYGVTGFTQGAGTTVTGVSSNPYNLTGLSPETTYDFYVRADCGASGGSGQSTWAGPFSFTTLCAAKPLNYAENFGASFPSCWSRNNSTQVITTLGCSGSSSYSLQLNGVVGVFAESPIIDVSGESAVQLSYFYRRGDNSTCGNTPESIDSVQVEYWAGSQWIRVKNYNGSTAANVFTKDSILITSGLTASFKFRFLIESGSGPNFDNYNFDSIFVKPGPSCLPPSNGNATNISAGAADLNWTGNGTATLWDLEYGLSGFTLGTGTSVSGLGSTTYNLTGLSGNTTYDFYVRSDCGTEQSSWSGPYTFTTLCAPFTAPYSQNFDGTTEPDVNACWNVINTAGPTAFAGTENFEFNSAPNSIELYNFNYSSGDIMLVSPEFSDFDNTKQIKMMVLDDDGTSDLEVGTMSDPSDPTTFTVFTTITSASLPDDVWQEVVVSFDTYVGTDNYVAFRHGMNDDFDNIYIDDFQYEVIPPCPTPTSFRDSNLTVSSAIFNWTPGATETVWELEYGPTGFSLGSGNLVSGITTRPYTLTGLTANTDYDVYLRADCGPVDGQSSWTGPVSIRTLPTPAQGVSCIGGAIPPVVFQEEFENNSAGWSGDINSGAGSWEIPGDAGSSNTGPSAAYSGSTSSYSNFEASGAGTTTASLISPELDLSFAASSAELSFWMHAFGASMGTLEVGVSTSATGPFTTLFTWNGQLQDEETDPWVNVGVDLSAYVGQKIYLEFKQSHSSSDFTGDMSIDLVEVVACESCPAPTSLTASNLTKTSVDINWLAGGTETEWDIEVALSGAATGNPTINNINSNPYTITGLQPATSYDVFLRADCGAGDTSFWTGPLTVTTLPGVVCPTGTETVLYEQEFDMITCLDSINGAWITGHSGGTGSGSTGPSGAFSGSTYMYHEASGVSAGTVSEYITGPIDLSNATNAALFSFYLHAYGGDIGTLDIGISTTGQLTGFTNIYTNVGQSQVNSFDAWLQQSINLAAYLGQVVYLRIQYTHPGGPAGDIAIDRMQVHSCLDCGMPSALTTSNLRSMEVDFSWTSSGSATGYEIEYGLDGFVPGTGTRLSSAATTINITGLMSGTKYDLFVRETCGGGNVGPWVGGACITTLCAPVAQTRNNTIYLDATGNAVLPADSVDDNSGGTCTVASISVSPNSFTCADIGSNIVTLEVISTGNDTATANATVDVLDTISPVLSLVADTLYLDASGNASLTASQLDNGSTDNCGINSLTVSKTNFNCDDLGINSVNVTAADNSANSATAPVNVVVLDTISPQAAANNVTVYLDNGGNAVLDTILVENGSVDNCGIGSANVSQNSFSCADLGSNTITYTVTDASGNSGSVNFTVNVEDTLKPVASATTVNAYLMGNGTVTLNAADFDNGSLDNCGINNFSVSPNIFDCSDIGSQTVNFKVTDASGNADSVNVTVQILDTLPPNNTPAGALALTSDTVYLDVNGLATIDSAFVDDGITDNCKFTSLSLAKTSLNCSDLGIAAIAVTATDSSGNTNTDTAYIPVADTIRPSAQATNVTAYLDGNGQATVLPSAADNGSSDNCSSLTFTLSDSTLGCGDLGANNVFFAVEDASGNRDSMQIIVDVIDTVSPSVTTKNDTAYLNAAGIAVIAVSDVSSGTANACAIDTVTLSQDTFTCADLGPNTVTVTAIASGGSASNSSTAIVTVLDTVSPVVATQGLTAYLDANGQATINATGLNNGSTDACGIAGFSVNQNTFNCTDLGNNTVTLTVIDNSGNSSSGPATVLVEDTIKPIVVTRDRTVYLNNNGLVTINTALVENGTTDNCNFTLSLSKATYDCSDEGLNQEYLIATDSDGNVDSAAFLLTVLDTISPTLIPRDITVQLGATGQASIAAAQLDSASSDNCSNQLFFTASKTTFNCDDLGANTVTVTATDVQGNTTSAAVTVSVEDNLNPTVLAQSATIYLDASGQASLTPSMVDNGSFDNCDVANLALSQSTFDCNDLGANTVNLLVTDSAGNTASASATITVLDTLSPAVSTQPATVYLDANGNGSLMASSIDAGSSDNCSIATYQLSQSSFSCSEVGTVMVSLTAEDGSGNQSSAMAVVTVVDTISPQALAQNLTLTLDATGNASITPADINNNSIDACGIANISVSPNSFGCADLGTNTVSLAVTDNNGNTSTTTASVTILDNTVPAVITQPVTVVLDANGQGAITTADVDNGSSDNCTIVNLSLDQSNFTCADLGTNVVSLTAVDGSGNSSSAIATVTVVDTLSPSVNTQNITVYLGANGTANITPGQVNNASSDNCTISNYSLDISNFDCSDVGPNNVTLTASDQSGNASSASAVVTVVDTVSPVAQLNNVTVSLDTSGTATVTGADFNNGSSDACGVNTLTVTPASFGCSDLGTNTVSVTVTDVNGNSTTVPAVVTVIDNTAPTVSTQNTIVYLDASGSATVTVADINNGSSDNCSVAASALSATSFDCTDIGQNPVTLTVTDGAGNSASATAIVIVRDTLSPSISNLPANIVVPASSSSCGANISWPAINATDNCSGVTVATSIPNGSFFGIGTTTVSVVATDGRGNTDSSSFDVTVNDTTSPLINNVPSNITVNADSNSCGTTVTWSVPTASDNCGPVSLSSTNAPGSTFNVGTTTVTYTATDLDGNSTTASFTVTVNDVTAPRITNLPANLTVNTDPGSCDAVVNFGNPTVVDNCTGSTFTVNPVSGSTFPIGTSTVSVTATDAAGNITTSTFTVTVVDNQAPVATFVPADDTVGVCDAAYSYNPVSATDNCGNVSVRQTAGVASGGVFPVGLTVNEFELTDAAGNTTLVSFTVTVIPQGQPVLPSIVQICNDGAPVDISNGQDIVFTGDGMRDSVTFDPNITGPGRKQISYVFTDDYGCQISGSITITVDPVPPQPVIEKVASNTLSTRGTYLSYQWYRDGVLIPGATLRTYTYNVGGNYQVLVGNNLGCTTYGDGFVVGSSGGGIGLDELSLSELSLYPNPSKGVVYLDFKSDNEDQIDVALFSVEGKKVFELNELELREGKVKLDIGHLPTATYFVHVRFGGQVEVRKLLMH